MAKLHWTLCLPSPQSPSLWFSPPHTRSAVLHSVCGLDPQPWSPGSVDENTFGTGAVPNLSTLVGHQFCHHPENGLAATSPRKVSTPALNSLNGLPATPTPSEEGTPFLLLRLNLPHGWLHSLPFHLRCCAMCYFQYFQCLSSPMPVFWKGVNLRTVS